MRIFLDANIVIDLIDDDRKYHNFSNKLFEQGVMNGDKFVISEDILTTVYYICKKNIIRKKLLNSLVIIINEFLVVNFKNRVIINSIKLCQKNNKQDFEDVLQAVCAEENNCDVIITNDKKFPQLKITAMTTKDFLKEYNKEE